MKTLVLFCVVCMASALAGQMTWEGYKFLYDKEYDEAEDNLRRAIFHENMRLVAKHNLEADNGLHSYRMGLNQFADLTNAEYRQILQRGDISNLDAHYQASGTDIPDSLDWRTSGFVGPVQDQGQCGDPVLFATVDALQFQEKNFMKSLLTLSTQQLQDCCNTTCPQGSCNCAFITDYLKCIKDLGGIEDAGSYPGEERGQCRFEADKVVLKVTGQNVVTTGDETAMKEAVADLGVAIAAIDASNLSFQFYAGGIYDEPNCSSTMLDHAVTVVGYGTESGVDYWIVKNSWGKSWGENGYIRMSRNKNNQCGIATETSIPITAKP